MTVDLDSATREVALSRLRNAPDQVRVQMGRLWPAAAGGEGTRTPIVRALHRLEGELRPGPRLRDKLRDAFEAAATTRDWAWLPLIGEPQVRAGLLCLSPRSHLPRHDHPDSLGVAVVLSGEVEVTQYDRIGADTAPLALRLVSRRWLRMGESTVVRPERGNTHEMTAGGVPTVLLDVIARVPGSRHGRRWYLSLDPRFCAPGPGASHAGIRRGLRDWLLLSGLCTTAAFSPASGCELHDGLSAYERREFQTAAQLLLPCAEADHAQAQVTLATMYREGEGLPRDMTEAGWWYQRAAELGVPEAQYRIGIMHLEGVGVTQNSEAALHWISQAANNGHGPAKTVYEYILSHDVALDC